MKLWKYSGTLLMATGLFLGYALLLVSVAGCILLPLSGFWLFIPQALIMILAKRKG